MGALRGRRRRKRRMRGRIMWKRRSREGRGSVPYDCMNATPQGKKRRSGGEGGVEVIVGVRVRREGSLSSPTGPLTALKESYSGLTA